ncbi:MAG: DNA repair protein RadC [Rhodocyclaceae bacterium]|nr:DNA repair protein RadC [Rhodocyclaceae bacterium]
MKGIEMEKRVIDMSNAELLEMICGSAGRSLAKQRLPEVFGICTPRQRSILAGEDREPYVVHPQIAAAKELYVRAIQEDMNASGVCLSSPNAVSSYLSGRIGNYEHEVFMCLWMDARNRLIVAEELFRGTLTQTSVYPREVVKRALFHNAAAVIFAHNHPSGDAEPSRSDEMLTNTLKTALALVDVRVLDHFVVAGNKTISFAERGVL